MTSGLACRHASNSLLQLPFMIVRNITNFKGEFKKMALQMLFTVLLHNLKVLKIVYFHLVHQKTSAQLLVVV